MAENRTRLGPFALKLIAKHGPKGAAPDGKVLDDLLIKAFADGNAFDLGLAGEIAERLNKLPEWEGYKSDLLAHVLGAVDGIGDESLTEFEKLNRRVDGIESDLRIAVKNMVILGKKIDELTELIKVSGDWRSF